MNSTTGNSIFGVEARECAGSADIENLTDYSPFQSGNCGLAAFGTGDLHPTVATAPPNQTATLHFKVGVGTQTFTLQDGVTQSTIACDAPTPASSCCGSRPRACVDRQLRALQPGLRRSSRGTDATALSAVAGNQSANVSWTARSTPGTPR